MHVEITIISTVRSVHYVQMTNLSPLMSMSNQQNVYLFWSFNPYQSSLWLTPRNEVVQLCVSSVSITRSQTLHHAEPLNSSVWLYDCKLTQSFSIVVLLQIQIKFFHHYVKYHFQGWLQCICRGGSASRPYARVFTNHAFVGAVPRPPLQIDLYGRLVLQPPLQIDLQGRSGNTSRPYKSICRCCYSTNRPYKSFFHKKN